MKIWVVGRNFPTKQNQMLGSFEFDQACMLARRGNTVLYPVVHYTSFLHLKKIGYTEETVNGVKVISITIPSSRFIRGFVRTKYKNFFQRRLYNRIEKEYGLPDVIHVHYPTIWNYIQFLPFQEKGTKIIATEHWTKVQSGEISEGYVNNLRRYVEKADVVLSVGEELAASINKLTGSDREIFLIPNIVTGDFSYRDETDPKKFRFVACGRVVKIKNFDGLVQAFSDAFADNEKVCLDIIGDGDQMTAVQNEIDRLHLTDRVRLLGIMNHQQIAEHFHRCNALVCSSSFETFGVPVIEAMASGMPVVTTDAIGFKHLFCKDHGEIVPVNDRAALADAMKKLYKNYSKFDREKISEYAQNTFSEEAVYKQLMKYYSGNL